jgi:ABC-type polysaccharide/polyol phosphate transport system ATPase subunit
MKSGDFLTIVGQVGCGKSSVLYTIMGETFVTKGSKKISGKIAYVE